MAATYYQGSDLPDLGVRWTDDDGDPVDFSSGWIFSAKLATKGTLDTLATKTSGFTGGTGANGADNLVVGWAISGDLNSLEPGRYTLEITATRTSDSKQRKMQVVIRVKAALS